MHLQVFANPLGFKVVPIVGGMASQKQARQLSQKPHVVVGTPGRLNEMFEQKNGYLSQLHALKFLVIDEADRMVTPGAYPELRKIFEGVKTQEAEAVSGSSFHFYKNYTTLFDFLSRVYSWQFVSVG